MRDQENGNQPAKKHNEVCRRLRNLRCFNFQVYLDCFKSTDSAANSFHINGRSSLEEAPTRAAQNSLSDCKTRTLSSERQFVHLKIMLILTVLLVGVLFGSVLCSFSSKNLESPDTRLDAVSSRLPTRADSFVAQKYSASNQSSLFYDLSLTNSDEPNDQQARKPPLYFHFISNKSTVSERINAKPVQSADKNRIKKFHKHFNRYRSLGSHQAYLQRFMLINDTAKCNDGTQASYYFRKGKNSKKWIVFLEGGWFCYSAFSCNHQRWVQMRNLMTSAHLPEKKLSKVHHYDQIGLKFYRFIAQ